MNPSQLERPDKVNPVNQLAVDVGVKLCSLRHISLMSFYSFPSYIFYFLFLTPLPRRVVFPGGKVCLLKAGNTHITGGPPGSSSDDDPELEDPGFNARTPPT
ncbi:hypothetical protein ACOMHN_049440 [Nucella lapillus]